MESLSLASHRSRNSLLFLGVPPHWFTASGSLLRTRRVFTPHQLLSGKLFPTRSECAVLVCFSTLNFSPDFESTAKYFTFV